MAQRKNEGKTLTEVIYETLQCGGPLTAGEIALLIGEVPGTVASRAWDLFRDGLVQRTKTMSKDAGRALFHYTAPAKPLPLGYQKHRCPFTPKAVLMPAPLVAPKVAAAPQQAKDQNQYVRAAMDAMPVRNKPTVNVDELTVREARALFTDLRAVFGDK